MRFDEIYQLAAVCLHFQTRKVKRDGDGKRYCRHKNSIDKLINGRDCRMTYINNSRRELDETKGENKFPGTSLSAERALLFL